MRVPPSFSSSSRSSPAFFDLDHRSSTLSLALDLRHDTTPPFVLALVCAPRVSLFFLPPPPALAPSLSPFLLLAHNICVVALLSSVVIIQCCTVLLTNTGIGVERGLSKGDRHIADVALARSAAEAVVQLPLAKLFQGRSLLVAYLASNSAPALRQTFIR